MVALAADPHPLVDAQPFDPFQPERILAVQVIAQAARDLEVPGRRAEAARFLLHGLWAPECVWRAWLPHLTKPVVEAHVRRVCAAPARLGDLNQRPRPRVET